MTDNALSADMIGHQRNARFGITTNEEWGGRIAALIEAREPGRSNVAVSHVRQVGVAAGGSNGTLLFDLDSNDSVAASSLVLRFLPETGLFHRYDVAGQFALQHALEGTDVPVARQLWLDAEGTHLGRPGYVMEQVAGEGPPMAWLDSGLVHDASPDDRRAMSQELIDKLIRIHRLDWRALGLGWLERRGEGTRPIEREANWYWEALTAAGIRDYDAALRPVRDWLIRNEPDDVEVGLCHGDCNFGNYMFEDTRMTAVLDWEMAFLGPAECDLTYFKIGSMLIPKQNVSLDGVIAGDQIYAEYQRMSGRRLVHLNYFELFSTYRIAIINVLAMSHLPKEVLADFMPLLTAGPKLCVGLARAQGVEVDTL